MKNSCYTFFLLLFTLPIFAQYVSGTFVPDQTKKPVMDFNDWSFKISSTITERDIKEHIFTLASDEFEGRETGEEGNMKAANYIAAKFEKLGLPKIVNNSYFQKIAFTFTSWKDTYFTNGDKEYRLLRDFLAFPQFSSSETKNDFQKIVFVGYGIEEGAYSDYKGVDVRDAVVMVYDGEPSIDGKSLISQSSTPSDWTTDWEKKSALAKKNGAALLMIVSNDLKEMINNNRRLMINRITQLGDYSDYTPSGVNTLFISPSVAQEILGEYSAQVITSRDALVDGGDKFAAVEMPSQIGVNLNVEKNVLAGQNVLGFIEGSDKKDEIVVVSAHYDHVGKKGDEVYNGADDDASGTTAVLEIAEALATSKRMGKAPRRSVLCLLVTGEEKGLLGSEYYAANPIFPIDKTVVDVNIDMIGRIGEEYIGSGEDYIYVIGSDRLSTDLHKISQLTNQKYTQLKYDYKYNDEADPNRFYFRSDHYNFAKNGIPAIFFFNGVHEDYHQLTDTPDKIEIPLMTKRAKDIFHLVWELANRNDRIRVDGEVK
jgi:hypothetical protein